MPKEKLKIIRDEPNKYHFNTKDDHRVDIEHKDKGIVLDMYKWGKEASLQLNLNIVLADTHQFQDNKIKIDTVGFTLRVYPINTRSTGDLYGDSEDDIQCHDGGLRFEIVLKGKPIVNSFTVPIFSKGLRFSKQPFLTQEDIDAGRRHPLNVDGSYAVYHISKKHNQYMTGKAFHIYRPIAEDATGSKAWCSIEIDAYLNPTSLTITIPQQFLDEATYPITIDPDFGYSTIGSSSDRISDDNKSYRVGSAWPMAAGGGTANFIKARIYGGFAVDCKVFINEKDSGGAGTHGQIATKENLACGAVEHWEEFTLSGETLTGEVDYILNIIADVQPGKTTYDVKYDADGAVESYNEWSAGSNYDAIANPWVEEVEDPTNDYSIYCDYSEEAPPAPPTFITPNMIKKAIIR